MAREEEGRVKLRLREILWFGSLVKVGVWRLEKSAMLRGVRGDARFGSSGSEFGFKLQQK